jgi:hypothetical protein
MRRSSVRFRQAAPRVPAGHSPEAPEPLVGNSRTDGSDAPRHAPKTPRSGPQVVIDQVPVEVHRHRRGRMPQHPLNHLRIRPGYSQIDAAVCRRSCTRKVGTPISLVATDHLIDRFQFNRGCPCLPPRRTCLSSSLSTPARTPRSRSGSLRLPPRSSAVAYRRCPQQRWSNGGQCQGRTHATNLDLTSHAAVDPP